MNYRQWKKKYKKEHGYNPPLSEDKRQQAKTLKKTNRCDYCNEFTYVGGYMDLNIEELIATAELLRERFRKLGEILGKLVNEIAESIEIIKEVLGIKKRPKYSFVRSLIKQYKQPYIKVRHTARSNL